MIDINCILRVKMDDAFLIHKCVHNEYKKYYLNGEKTKAIETLKTLSKIEKLIKGHKGYETHDFSKKKD